MNSGEMNNTLFSTCYQPAIHKVSSATTSRGCLTTGEAAT